MRVTEVPARDARPLITEVHADLVALLASLRDPEWAAPTEAGRWTVKDVALHLLDGDLGQLSMGRDGILPGCWMTAAATASSSPHSMPRTSAGSRRRAG